MFSCALKIFFYPYSTWKCPLYGTDICQRLSLFRGSRHKSVGKGVRCDNGMNWCESDTKDLGHQVTLHPQFVNADDDVWRSKHQ